MLSCLRVSEGAEKRKIWLVLKFWKPAYIIKQRQSCICSSVNLSVCLCMRSRSSKVARTSKLGKHVLVRVIICEGSFEKTSKQFFKFYLDLFKYLKRKKSRYFTFSFILQFFSIYAWPTQDLQFQNFVAGGFWEGLEAIFLKIVLNYLRKGLQQNFK